MKGKFMLEISDIIAVVRDEKYRSVIETDSGKFARLLDIGEVDGNPNLFILCFEEHQYSLIYLEGDTFVKECGDGWNREFKIYADEGDDEPEYTIKCKMIKA